MDLVLFTAMAVIRGKRRLDVASNPGRKIWKRMNHSQTTHRVELSIRWFKAIGCLDVQRGL